MKESRKRRLPALAAAVALAGSLCLGQAGAQEQDWRGEFEAVCVKTDLAMSLPSEELAELVARCDRLAERIGAEGESVRKVYLKRLNSCRALFVYVLEMRSAAPAGGGAGAGAPTPQDQPPLPKAE